MKKMIALAGAATLLAACSPSFKGGQTSDSLTLRQVTNFTSQYQLSQNYTDPGTGRFLPAGTDVICDNRATQIQFDFTWSGDLFQAGVRLKGERTGAVTTTVFSNATADGDFSGSGSGTITINPGVAPLSVSLNSRLSAQAIVPTPIPPSQLDVKGYSYLQVVANDSQFRNSNVIESDTVIPVADCD